jgi:hypothetical protein
LVQPEPRASADAELDVLVIFCRLAEFCLSAAAGRICSAASASRLAARLQALKISSARFPASRLSAFPPKT